MTDSSYELPEEENERIFRERIVPRELSHAQPQDRPTVIFLAGQQGAGKSRSLEHFSRELEARGGFVNVNSDTYKPYHTSYSQIVGQDDRLMAAYTGPDGQKWFNKAHSYARDNNLNVICEETMQNPEYFAEMAQAYRDDGYRVEVAILAVPKAQSQQGILNRYYEQTKDGGPGRLTVPAKHEASYGGILETADLIDSERLADSVSVYRRGGELLYSNHLTSSGEWAAPPATRAAIESERERQWTPEESAEFKAKQQKLADGLGDDWSGQLGEIDALAEPHLSDEASRTAADPSTPEQESDPGPAPAEDAGPPSGEVPQAEPEPTAESPEPQEPAEEDPSSSTGKGSAPARDAEDSYDYHEDEQMRRIADAAGEGDAGNDGPEPDPSPRTEERERGGMGD